MGGQSKREPLMLLLIFSPKPDSNFSIYQLFNILKKLSRDKSRDLPTQYLYFKMLRTMSYSCAKF